MKFPFVTRSTYEELSELLNATINKHNNFRTSNLGALADMETRAKIQRSEKAKLKEEIMVLKGAVMRANKSKAGMAGGLQTKINGCKYRIVELEQVIDDAYKKFALMNAKLKRITTKLINLEAKKKKAA